MQPNATTTRFPVVGVAPNVTVSDTELLPLFSVDEFFAVPMDAVIISSPIHLHEEQCVRAFAAGLHVLVEKPLSNTIASCERIVAAAKGLFQ